MNHWHDWSFERCTTFSRGSSISTTSKCWWKMARKSLCSLAYWEIFLVPTQSTSFWFPAHEFSEIQALCTVRNISDQQQWICTEERLFLKTFHSYYTFLGIFLLNTRSNPVVCMPVYSLIALGEPQTSSSLVSHPNKESDWIPHSINKSDSDSPILLVGLR